MSSDSSSEEDLSAYRSVAVDGSQLFAAANTRLSQVQRHLTPHPSACGGFAQGILERTT